jgi:hypothetical protein
MADPDDDLLAFLDRQTREALAAAGTDPALADLVAGEVVEAVRLHHGGDAHYIRSRPDLSERDAAIRAAYDAAGRTREARDKLCRKHGIGPRMLYRIVARK